MRSLFSRLTLRKRQSKISVDPFSLGAKSVPGVMTHSRSRQTTETTLTTLSGETYDTTLSSNTLRSRGTSSALNKMPQQAVSNDTSQWALCEVHRDTHGGTIGTRGSLLSTRSWGSNTTNLTRATSRTGLTTSSSSAILANRSEGSGWSSNSLDK